MNFTIDHPLTRQQEICPICNLAKSQGFIVCCSCYLSLGMRYGNLVVEAVLDTNELKLEMMQQHGTIR